MFLLLIVWEAVSTDLKLTHLVLVLITENVFNVFPRIYPERLKNVQSSTTLLVEGFLTSLVAANIIGLFVGRMPRARKTVFPIAHVLAPISAIVFAPYLGMLLPSVELPEGLGVIGNDCFSGCVSLERINLPATLKSLRVCAFRHCVSFDCCELPVGVEHVGEDVFIGCWS